MKKDISKLTPEQKDELFADVRALLNNPALEHVLGVMQETGMAELMNAPLGTLTATAAHAKLCALEAIRAELKALANKERYR